MPIPMSGAADQRAQMAGAPPPSGNPQEEEKAIVLAAGYAAALLEIDLEVIAKSPNQSVGSPLYEPISKALKDLSSVVSPQLIAQCKSQILGAGQRAPQGAPPQQGMPQRPQQGMPQQQGMTLQEAMI